ncbi:MAG: hypothetical protein JNK26_03745 [Candidatus Doudnabacteria bacterium]|nr:hypothetical protein [Candidatus Doudnabacteria bacterium]
MSSSTLFWDFLKDFEFSVYEIKSLAGILRLGTCTPTEIVEAESIPSSKIYSALSSLKQRGLIVESDNGYSLVATVQLIEILKKLQLDEHTARTEKIANLETFLLHQKSTNPAYQQSLSDQERALAEFIRPALSQPFAIYLQLNLPEESGTGFNSKLLNELVAIQRDNIDYVILPEAMRVRVPKHNKSKLKIRFGRSTDRMLMLWGDGHVVERNDTQFSLGKWFTHTYDRELFTHKLEDYWKAWYAAQP